MMDDCSGSCPSCPENEEFDISEPENDEFGCLFPGKCLMPGPHLTSECHTIEMVEPPCHKPDGKDLCTGECSTCQYWGGQTYMYTQDNVITVGQHVDIGRGLSIAKGPVYDFIVGEPGPDGYADLLPVYPDRWPYRIKVKVSGQVAATTTSKCVVRR